MGSHERKLAHTTNVGETSLNNNGKSRNYMFIPNPLLWHGVREYSAAANHNSRYHVRRPNERQTNGRKYPFVILISKARCFISFSPETINFREHATQSQSRALSTRTHHTPTPPPSDTTAETGGRAAMTIKLAFWNRAAVPRRMHLHRSAVGCAKP